MIDAVLWRKQSHIIMMVADALKIDAEQALDLFYSTNTYQQLSDPKYCMHLMSDQYIVDDVLKDLSRE
ncbi:MAG: DUF3791 domain-containing protein [Prevotella sp.]|nr:DUF3791 domain-containing protein [Prevotella sp.]